MSLPAARDPERAKRTSVIRQYRRDGYRVAVPARGDALPAFLDGLAPDLVAERNDDRVVVKIKRADRVAGSNDLVAIAERIDEQPGWRFEFISVAPPVEVDLLGEGEFDIVEQLLDQHAYPAAFLLRFVAIENILAFAAASSGRPAPSIVGTAGDLVASGVLSSELLTEVRDAAKLRNAVAHGIAGETPDRRDVLRLDALVKRLRKEIGEQRSA